MNKNKNEKCPTNKLTMNNDGRIRSRRVKLTQHRIDKNINEIILVPRERHMLEIPIINYNKEFRYEKFAAFIYF